MKYIIIFFLLCGSVSAGEYACIFIDNSIPQDSVSLVLENTKGVGVDSGIIDQASMPIWKEKADTNTTGKVICTRTDTLGVKGWKNLPLAQVETRVTKDVRSPNKQKVKVYSREEFKSLYSPVITEIQ